MRPKYPEDEGKPFNWGWEMLAGTFEELHVEFKTILEIAQSTDDLRSRKALLRQANDVFHTSKDFWQQELRTLRGMIETLQHARADFVKMAAERHDVSYLSIYSPPRAGRAKAAARHR